MLIASLMSTQRSAASVIFAIAIIPILGLCGLAVDYGIWARIDSEMTMAANTAALNAVKIAATAEVNKDPNAVAEGNQTGAAWFNAEAGGKQPYMAGIVTPSVTTTVGPVVSASVSFSGSIYSIFGKLFGVRTFPISGQVQASEQIASFLHVEILLDNSPSMAIGASDIARSYPAAAYPFGPRFKKGNFLNVISSDVAVLEQLSPCWPTNALYQISTAPHNGSTDGFWLAVDGENYWNFQVSGNPGSPGGGLTYTGGTPLPVTDYVQTLNGMANFVFTPTTYPTKSPFSFSGGDPGCVGGPAEKYVPPASAFNPPQTVLANVPPRAGPPCAFACHYDAQAEKTSLGSDLYAMARQNNVTLRFDNVKAATSAVIDQMRLDDLATGNLQVGVFSFDQTVHQQYPKNSLESNQNSTTCIGNGLQASLEAGGGWAAAEAAVGYYDGETDQGILPVLAHLAGTVSNDDTDIEGSLDCLATKYVSPVSANVNLVGRTAQTPGKVLFLVTDGFEDFIDASGVEQRRPLDPSKCQHFKDPVSAGGMGYTVYVLYTPYYQVKHEYFFSVLNSDGQIMYNGVTPDGSSPLDAALAACSSDPSKDFLTATDEVDLERDLKTFLRAALNNVAKFDM